MKYHILSVAVATIVTSHAGTPEPEPAVTPAPESEPWVKPTINIRARYEYGNVDSPALESSNAFTTRERVGLITKDFHGFSALVEGEFTQAIGDDYAVNGNQPGVTPFNPGQTFIADPETNELNQAYIQYKGFDSVLKGGRQRIILDNAAFVGNVGWRQNEQTYDAFTFTNQSIEDLNFHYSYANRANRIFGSDAQGALRSFAGDMHFFNLRYDGIKNTSITGYAYLMDFNKTAANAGYISNNTYGAIASTKLDKWTFRAEAAYQTDTDSSPANVDNAGYMHLNVGYAAFGCHTFGLGWEYLDEDFVTPLATVHAFNGFADVFIGRRIGLNYNPGLNDVYLSHKWKTGFWGLNFAQFFHVFGDNDTEFDFGWEYDAVLSKKFNDNFTAIAKFSYFDSAGATGKAINYAPLFDTTRVSLELNYTF
ncbi:hypothetical protein [Haloferula sp.]|uniref:hypothetical protein n=1 Tax=Haloferula sp. TaxID=2497595 RepID=UPI00329FDE55